MKKPNSTSLMTSPAGIVSEPQDSNLSSQSHMTELNPLSMSFGEETASPANSVARGLHILLLIVMAVLAITCAALFIIGVLMLFPNGIREGVFAELQIKGVEAKGAVVGLTCFAFAIMSGAYMAVILILRKIVNTLMEGDPFVPENISRLRIMWIILAASEIFRMIIHLIGANGDEGMINIRLGTWFMVFVIAALSEVFRHGAKLRRDQELTV